MHHAILGEQLAAAIEANTSPSLLERWLDIVVGLMDARTEVRQSQSLISRWLSQFKQCD